MSCVVTLFVVTSVASYLRNGLENFFRFDVSGDGEIQVLRAVKFSVVGPHGLVVGPFAKVL